MSEEDKQAWKAKYIKGKNERVEIHKVFSSFDSYSQVLIVVYKDGVHAFMNGKTGMTNEDLCKFMQAISEAEDLLASASGAAENQLGNLNNSLTT